MKNKDSLVMVFLILIILGCKCQSDLFNVGKKSVSENEETNVVLTNTKVSNLTPKTESNRSNTNTSELGEYLECSKRGNVTYNVDPNATPVSIKVNNKSPIRLQVYSLGRGGDWSKFSGIDPGDTFSFKIAFRGEWYMIADTDGNCKMLFAPPNEVNVK